MNPSATLLSSQMILSWTLLGVLLAWMFFCVFLALRPRKAETREAANLPTPSGAFPAIRPQISRRLVSAPVDRAFGTVPLGSTTETVREVGSAPVA